MSDNMEFFEKNRETIINQFKAVRNTGQANMIQYSNVQLIAESLGHMELADFCAKCNMDEYSTLLDSI